MNNDGGNNQYGDNNLNGQYGNNNPYSPVNNYNNNSDSNYNNMNMNSGYDANKFIYNKKNKKKKIIKIAAATAAIVVLSVGSGITGSIITYNTIKGNILKNNSEKSFVAPEFTSSTDGSLTVSQAFEKVKPAVVTISTKTISKGNIFEGNSESEGMGSGFIINEDGYVLTNYHVVKGATELSVLLSDGKEVSAKVVNYDEGMDLAMIKLADGTKVPGIAELGDSSSLYAGQDVIAIGTPLSTEFAQTLTKGIISSPSRTISQTSSGEEINVIQTDAAINPGNSGGPLVNTKGQVIGINSSKISSISGTSIDGMGFAIPINEAKDRIDSLSKPIVTIGITVVEFDSAAAKKYDTSEGLYVKSVNDFSAAERAGIKPGDVITEFNGTRITKMQDLTEAKSKVASGDTVKIVVDRSGRKVTLDLTLTEN